MQRDLQSREVYNIDIMKDKNTIHIKVDQTKLPNKLHFEVQKNTRATVFKPKKGKGSFKRNKKVDNN